MADKTQQLDASFEEASQTPDVPRDWRERILGAGASKGGSLEKAVMAHHQARLDEAQMYRRNMASVAGLLTHGIDPKTGQPLTDEQKQQYQNQYQAAKAAYQKIMGVNKQTKAALQQQDAVIGHMMRGGMAQPPVPGATASPPGGAAPGETPAGASAGPGPAPGGGTETPTAQMSTPPAITPQKPNTLYQRSSDIAVSPQGTARNAAGAEITGAGGPRMTPPPAASTAPAEEDQLDLATRLPFERQAVEQRAGDERAANLKKRELMDKAQVEFEADKKFHINEAKRKIQDTEEALGRPLTDDEKQQVMGMFPKPKLKVTTVPDPDSETGYSNQAWDENTGKVYGKQLGALPPRGFVGTESVRQTTDPVTRQTTVSKSTRVPIGFPTPKGSASVAAPAAPSRQGVTPVVPSARGGTRTGVATTGAPPLTPDGLIDPNWNGASPQVIEGANQLIQDRDVDKIPSKTRELSAALARRAGWYQGRFTPKEQVLLKEATTFLQRAASDPSLSVLDSTKSKLKLGQVAAASSGKEGFIGRTLGTLAAGTETAQEAAFMRMYNQLVGTVSGLSQLVRSGRATEAQIERLKAELPSIIQSPNSADAKARIQRLLNEVSLAMERGQFQGARPDMAPPPSPGGGSVDDEIMRAVGAARH